MVDEAPDKLKTVSPHNHNHIQVKKKYRKKTLKRDLRQIKLLSLGRERERDDYDY